MKNFTYPGLDWSGFEESGPGQSEWTVMSPIRRVINIKFLLQPHQKYDLTQYGELGFSQLAQIKDDYTINSHYLTYTFHFIRLRECTFRTWKWKTASVSNWCPASRGPSGRQPWTSSGGWGGGGNFVSSTSPPPSVDHKSHNMLDLVFGSDLRFLVLKTRLEGSSRARPRAVLRNSPRKARRNSLLTTE